MDGSDRAVVGAAVIAAVGAIIVAFIGLFGGSAAQTSLVVNNGPQCNAILFSSAECD